LGELTGAVAEAWAGHTQHSPGSSAVAAGPSAGQPSVAGTDADAGADGKDADAADGSNAEECREYRLRACYLDAGGERRLERLVVTADQPDGDWPAISWQGRDVEESLTPGPAADGQRSYTPRRPIAAAQPLTFRVELAGLDVVSQQTARASVSVSRNAVLQAGSRTAAEFVLTSASHLRDAALPANAWLEPIALTGDNVAQALQGCFDTLFGARPNDGRLSLDIYYGYLIGGPASAGVPDSTDSLPGPAPADPGLRAVLPVASLPVVDLAPDLAATLAGTAEDWRRQTEPPTTGAEWYFCLALLSPHPGEPPLLAFDRLVFAEESGTAVAGLTPGADATA